MNGLEFINIIKSRIEFASASYNSTGKPTYKQIESFIVNYDESEMELMTAFFSDWDYNDSCLETVKDKAIARIRWLDCTEILASKVVLGIHNGKLQPVTKIVTAPVYKANVTLWLGVDTKKARKEHLMTWYEDVKSIISEETAWGRI